MRILHGVLMLLMLVFMAVQYNDPDGLKWLAIYGLPAVLMLLAVVHPMFYRTMAGRCVRGIAVVALAAGVVWFWPNTADFWHQEVWWETEPAREGMGVMIAFIVALSAFLIRTAHGNNNQRRHA